MPAIYLIIVAVISIFIWKFLSKRIISQGRSKVMAHGSGIIAAVTSFFLMMVFVAANVEVPTKELDSAAKTQQFKDDQQALIAYFNKITPAKTYVDLNEQEVTAYLEQNNIVAASESAKKCADATKLLSKELDRGEYKAPTLSDKKQNKVLKKTIEKLAAGYDFRQAQCSAVYRYLDDHKPTIATEIKEQKALADGTIDLAMSSLKKNIAAQYKIELSNGIYVAMK